MLEKCPLNFYLKYVIKAKPSAEYVEQQQTTVGKAAHKILELILKGSSIKEAYATAKVEYSTVLSEPTWVEQVESLELSITKFKERIQEFQSTNPVKAFHHELRLGITRDYKPTTFFAKDVWFRGVLDTVIELQNNDAIYLDHKTGAASAGGLKNYKKQLDTYKILHHFGKTKVQGSQSGIHFIREGVILLDDYTETADIESSLVKGMEFRLECAVDNLNNLGYFKHVAGSHCKWCDFAKECKSGELKSLESSSKDY